MRDEAEAENKTFIKNLKDGHHLIYLGDIAYIKSMLDGLN